MKRIALKMQEQACTKQACTFIQGNATPVYDLKK
jgi:hypothetical protein